MVQNSSEYFTRYFPVTLKDHLKVFIFHEVNPFSVRPIKCSSTLKQFVGNIGQRSFNSFRPSVPIYLNVFQYCSDYYRRTETIKINEYTGTKWVNPFHTTGLFLSPWKHQKTSGFLMFSGDVEIEHEHQMG